MPATAGQAANLTFITGAGVEAQNVSQRSNPRANPGLRSIPRNQPRSRPHIGSLVVQEEDVHSDPKLSLLVEDWGPRGRLSSSHHELSFHTLQRLHFLDQRRPPGTCSQGSLPMTLAPGTRELGDWVCLSL